MTRVLVSGANGHIGANTVRSLLRRGYEVVPFVRSTSNLRGIDKLGLSYRYGDVMDFPSLLEAAQGCDAIIHHATVYRMWARNPDDILQPAMVGTDNIFRAAREAGIRRLVYTSSMAAVGYLSEPVGLMPATAWNEAAKSPYYIAKTRSEREALRLSEEYGIPTIRLCPTHVVGPFDYGITPSTRTILNYVNKTGTTFEGGTNYVHVFDVGEVHALAVERGEPGSRYIVGGDNLHLKELSALITQLTGVKPAHLGITGPVAEMVGTLVGFTSKFTGSEPPFDGKVIHDVVGRYGYFDCSPTNQTFGITPRGLKDVVSDTIRWLLFLGKIKPEVAGRISADFPPDPDW